MNPTPVRDLLADLRELTALPAPVGWEEPVAVWLKARLDDASLPAAVDSLGNLRLVSDQVPPRLLITAHMDQVGYVVSRVEDRHAVCLPLGGPDVTLSHRVAVRVLGDGDRRLDAELESLGDAGATISVGRTSGVRQGDVVVFAAELREREAGVVESPALDDRIGCLIALRAACELAAEGGVAFAWTVREEEEQSGIVRVARDLDPGAIVGVDITFAVADGEGAQSPLRPGAGPAITVRDGGMVAHRSLLRSFDSAAESLGIAWQREVVMNGISEAGRAQQTLGIPSLALVVPIDNPHSHRETAFLSDIDAAIRLLVGATREILRQAELAGVR